MTEKRFKLSEPNGAYLIDSDKPLFPMNDSDDEIVELLNKLSEENKELKSDKEEWRKSSKYWSKEHTKLEKENEQLKQLLDYADDLILSYMSVHNRDEWENIKKNIKGDV